ncbi:hypothetical protein I7I48_03019 [Histoplasma ohiense]|nr:hypothetical protein I7I48_03019 [Histoplasma ohiense (nom. inval.)]
MSQADKPTLGILAGAGPQSVTLHPAPPRPTPCTGRNADKISIRQLRHRKTNKSWGSIPNLVTKLYASEPQTSHYHYFSFFLLFSSFWMVWVGGEISGKERCQG